MLQHPIMEDPPSQSTDSRLPRDFRRTCLTPTRGCKSLGTLSKSCTVSMRPMTSKAPLEALERYSNLYQTGQIPEYHSIVDTILNWSEEILAWHHNRRSNGPLEGINNLTQTLRRTAHGFTNPHNYAARGLLLA